MKPFIISFAVYFILTSLAFSQPKLEIEGGNTYNWGKVNYKNSPVNAKIKLKNVGNETLKISEVKPGCGCTAAPLDKYEIAPGEFSTLSVSLNISTYSGETVKSIRISSNDPQNGDTYLFIKADVYRPVVVQPSNYLGRSNIYVGKPEEFNFSLKNQTNKNMKITSVEIMPKEATCDIKVGDVLPANQDKKYIIKYTAKKGGERLNGSLKINTSDEEAGEIGIYFYGNIVNPESTSTPK